MDEKTRTSSRSGGAFRAALLLLSLLALVLGVFGAVYLDQFRSHPAPSLAERQAPANESQPAIPVTPPQLTLTVPEKPPLPPAVSPAALPSPAPTAAAPAEAAPSLAVISPAAAPANIAAAAPRYWIEFGAYDGERYAGILRQKLADLGIEATISGAPGKGGKRYLRVRTAADSDRAAAETEARKASKALHITPLLHRAATAAVVPAAPLRNATTSAGPHWVQFGAFRPRDYAATLAARLVKNGMKAIVLSLKSSSNRPLYRVRVEGLADRAAAERVARQGAIMLRSKDVLIGQAPRAGPAASQAR